MYRQDIKVNGAYRLRVVVVPTEALLVLGANMNGEDQTQGQRMQLSSSDSRDESKDRQQDGCWVQAGKQVLLCTACRFFSAPHVGSQLT